MKRNRIKTVLIHTRKTIICWWFARWILFCARIKLFQLICFLIDVASSIKGTFWLFNLKLKVQSFKFKMYILWLFKKIYHKNNDNFYSEWIIKWITKSLFLQRQNKPRDGKLELKLSIQYSDFLKPKYYVMRNFGKYRN